MNANEGPPAVPAPIPAPYLAGVPQLEDELLARLKSQERAPCRRPMTAAEAKRVVQRLREVTEMVFKARTAYEKAAGIKILPEPPAFPG